jgi:DNA-3-methyladenine glycosylase II
MDAPTDLFRKAQRHLTHRDAVLKTIIAEVGGCTLTFQPNPFALLLRSIVSQQISTKAAQSIHGRLRQALGRDEPTPADVLALTDDALKDCGLSAQKRRYIRGLAERVENGTVPLHDLTELSDDEVVARLVQFLGVGPWTAQMVLIFGLGRPDVLPVDDFGVRAAVRRLYKLEELPNRASLTTLAEPWRPYRSVACWYLWRSGGPVPQSEAAEDSSPQTQKSGKKNGAKKTGK